LSDEGNIAMKRLLIALLIGSAMLSLPVAGLAGGGTIQFKKGQTSQTIKGRFGSYNDTYTFRARKGQKLSAILKSAKSQNGTLNLTIYAYCGEEYGTPLADRVQNWSGTLPCTDKYSMDVMTSTEGVTDNRPLNESYTLQLRMR
jgi:hypothetical protein